MKVDRGKISVNITDISSIYRLWTDISNSKSVKVAACKKMQKKKKKKNHFGLDFVDTWKAEILSHKFKILNC